MLSGINWLAVLVAAVLSFGVGAVWFGPFFGKAWMEEVNKTPEELGSPTKAMSLSAVTTLITAIALAYVFDVVGVGNWMDGVLWGLSIGLFFVGTSMYSDSLFHGASTRLATITIGHRVVYFTVMGAVLGAWPG